MKIQQRIKLLIVIAILGVMAVLILHSGKLLLFLSEEQTRMEEYRVVSLAVIAMMNDNNLSAIPNPKNFDSGVGVNDMTAFPDSISVASSADKPTDPKGQDYRATIDRDGYILYGHDITAGAETDFINYITQCTTKYYYTCEANGKVRQFADASLTTEYIY